MPGNIVTCGRPRRPRTSSRGKSARPWRIPPRPAPRQRQDEQRPGGREKSLLVRRLERWDAELPVSGTALFMKSVLWAAESTFISSRIRSSPQSVRLAYSLWSRPIAGHAPPNGASRPGPSRSSCPPRQTGRLARLQIAGKGRARGHTDDLARIPAVVGSGNRHGVLQAESVDELRLQLRADAAGRSSGETGAPAGPHRIEHPVHPLLPGSRLVLGGELLFVLTVADGRLDRDAALLDEHSQGLVQRLHAVSAAPGAVQAAAPALSTGARA